MEKTLRIAGIGMNNNFIDDSPQSVKPQASSTFMLSRTELDLRDMYVYFFFVWCLIFQHFGSVILFFHAVMMKMPSSHQKWTQLLWHCLPRLR